MAEKIIPVTTEKAVMMLEKENTIIFEVGRQTRKEDIKKRVEEIFNVKVDSVNVLTRNNKKRAYVKLNKENPAMDVATKLGMI
jgi:ribosomal protein L23